MVLKIRDRIPYMYTLNGTELTQVHEQRDLGVIISDDLLPDKHITEIIKKANLRIGVIKRCFSGLNERKIVLL